MKVLKKQLKNRIDSNYELMLHLDRGLKYYSNTYQEILAKNDIKCSMTESYGPYQNTVIEHINGILKQDFLIDTTKNGIDLMKIIVQ